MAEQAANRAGGARDDELVRRVTEHLNLHARDLPWRDRPAGSRDAYITLVSELMLQQTQVARVLEKFAPFLERFATMQALADAAEIDVLAAWSGLGYYRRARLLQAAAKAVMEDFGGTMPRSAEKLLTIPGVGRYTAGAIASLAFNEPAALVDGNVTRVLLRLEGKPGRLGEKETAARAWLRAEELMETPRARAAAGKWNEGLMELGATICVPVSPRCEECPVREYCRAYAEGTQDEIPAAKVAKARGQLHWAVVVFVREGKVWLTRRAARGLFAGLMEAPTLETTREASRANVTAFARGVGGAGTTVRKVGIFTHVLSHREISCLVFVAEKFGELRGGAWERDVAGAALANVQRRAIALVLGGEN